MFCLPMRGQAINACLLTLGEQVKKYKPLRFVSIALMVIALMSIALLSIAVINMSSISPAPIIVMSSIATKISPEIQFPPFTLSEFLNSLQDFCVSFNNLKVNSSVSHQITSKFPTDKYNCSYGDSSYFSLEI